jgi:hypothetical protein
LKDWRIADTETGNLRLWETAEGVFFEIGGVNLPLNFSGVSIKLEPVRRVRESILARRIVESGIGHIALLRVPEEPAYPQTFLQTIRLSDCPSRVKASGMSPMLHPVLENGYEIA